MPKKKSKQETPRRPAKPPPKRAPAPKPAMVIRRNASPRPAIPARSADDSPAVIAHRNTGRRQSKGTSAKNSSTRRRNTAPRQQTATAEQPKPLRERIAQMGMSHLATKTGSEVLGSALAILVVGKGWLGPKSTAGILAGTGVATAAAGYAMEADHVMVAGTGLAHVGLLSLTNTVAVEAFQAHEKRQAEARQLAEAEKAKPQGAPRNARRLVIIDADGNVLDDEDYADHAAA